MIRLKTFSELETYVNEVGLLPLFSSGDGFSVEDFTKGNGWFEDTEDDPWAWRRFAFDSSIIYAKFFKNKAGFVSHKAFAHLANFRRDGYDFDTLKGEGLISDRCAKLYGLIDSGLVTTTELKAAFGKTGYESAITELQMRTYVIIDGFTYKINKAGEPYGWSITCYTTAEKRLGDLCSKHYDIEPAESYRILTEMIKKAAPNADADKLLK